ncbi:MAG TPA: polysaccharide biosynthesis/export family protein [Vicinamibacterales bacterium]|nr:polysaccharide biosynthesis/export family protein [Vicinamibacterales bacterium]
MRVFLKCLALAAVVLLVAWSPVRAQSVEYRLGAQDKIRVTVFNEPSLSGEFEVDGEGRVSLPLVGEVALGQMTLREAERAIAAKLHPDYLLNPKVSVEVTNYRPFYILGEVKQPGGYPYANGMTIMQAVALAGGFTYRARQNEMLIVRGGSRMRVAPETAVLPGDIIEVPERFF